MRSFLILISAVSTIGWAILRRVLHGDPEVQRPTILAGLGPLGRSTVYLTCSSAVDSETLVLREQARREGAIFAMTSR